MSEIELKPLSLADLGLMADLMNDEERAWLRELDWDYAPIRRILFSFLQARILPGFHATNGAQAFAYSYFLIARAKGVIGTVYARGPNAQDIADRVLSRAIASLQENRGLHRIEAQIIPFSGLDPTSVFSRHDFQCYRRHYLELDLPAGAGQRPSYSGAVELWQPGHLLPAAGVAFRSYQGGLDAEICEDYGAESSCAAYLHSLTENPGCGIFLPGASFVGLDRHGALCGFILTSRLSPHAAMIPQISIHPAHQGRGLGIALIRRVLHQLASDGFRAVRLTVTRQNRRAYEWYMRLGFKVRRDFDACVWQRK
jgi:ribosomal protein S18 acetylase RimI-like enzyme